MTRPVALVTGANRGLGLQVAKDLFAKGYSVVLGCRDVGKGRSAMTEIAKPYEDQVMGEGHKLSVIKLDLSDSNTIPAAVEEFKKYQDRLDVLVNNAGIYVNDRKEVLRTNFYNTIAVTEAFLPLLAATKSDKKKGRVVIVSSRMGSLSGIKGDALTALKDPQDLDKIKALAKAWEEGDDSTGLSSTAYSSSKALVSAYGRILAKRLAEEQVPVNVIITCPGYTKTDMTNNQGTKSLEDGADTLSWAAYDDSLESSSGKFYGERSEISF